MKEKLKVIYQKIRDDTLDVKCDAYNFCNSYVHVYAHRWRNGITNLSFTLTSLGGVTQARKHSFACGGSLWNIQWVKSILSHIS